MGSTGRNTGQGDRNLQLAIRAAQAARENAVESGDNSGAARGAPADNSQVAREIAFRLMLLCEALAGVFDDLPRPGGEFVLAVTPAVPSRYVIDHRTHVEIADDLRTYLIVAEGYGERHVLLESVDVDVVADAVTQHVAERIVDRQAQDGQLPAGAIRQGAETGGKRNALRPDGSISRLSAATSRHPHNAPSQAMQGIFWAGAGFGLGVLAGIFLLLVYAWVAVG